MSSVSNTCTKKKQITHHIFYYPLLYLFLLKTGKVLVCFLLLYRHNRAERKWQTSLERHIGKNTVEILLFFFIQNVGTCHQTARRHTVIDNGLNNHLYERLRSSAYFSVGSGFSLYLKFSQNSCNNNGMILLQNSKFKVT